MLDAFALSRTAMQSRAAGLLFFTFFGAWWGVYGTSLLNAGSQGLVYSIIAIIAVILLILACVMIWSARRLPRDNDAASRTAEKRIGRIFGLVFGLEGVFIAITSIVLSSLHLFVLFAPVVAIIVGLHFLPLAPLFSVKIYYITGSVIALLGLIGLLMLASQLHGSNAIIHGWQAFVDLGCTTVLWLTSFVSASQGIAALLMVRIH